MKRVPLKRKTPLRTTAASFSRKPIRSQSSKFRQRASESKSLRDELIRTTGRCMVCGTSPRRPLWPIEEHNRLCCHEILNGPLRQKVLDEPSCLIVACWRCNQIDLADKKRWPLDRQLALIKSQDRDRYDLARVLHLRNEAAKGYITEDDVDRWIEFGRAV
jgi:hypothetical protein